MNIQNKIHLHHMVGLNIYEKVSTTFCKNKENATSGTSKDSRISTYKFEFRVTHSTLEAFFFSRVNFMITRNKSVILSAMDTVLLLKTHANPAYQKFEF